MKKGISATNLIVALAVGLIVIVGLGYLVWTWMSKGGTEVTVSYCKSRAVVYCGEWQIADYDSNWPLENQNFTGNPNSFAPRCEGKLPQDVDADYCRILIGVD